jgi:hypothetical protein
LGEARRGIFFQRGLDWWNHADFKGEFFSFIPGRAESANPESIATMGRMDSEPAPRVALGMTGLPSLACLGKKHLSDLDTFSFEIDGELKLGR